MFVFAQQEEDAIDPLVEQCMDAMPGMEQDFPEIKEAMKRKQMKSRGYEGTQPHQVPVLNSEHRVVAWYGLRTQRQSPSSLSKIP